MNEHMSDKQSDTKPAIWNDSLREVTTYQAGIAQAAAHRLLQKVCDHILKPYGLTKMQWLIVGTVRDAGEKGIRITGLTQAIGTTMPYMTTSVNLLESKGILRRTGNQGDNRSKIVVLAEDFAGNCEEIETALRTGLRKSIYRDIDPTDFRNYIKVLFQLHNIEA